MKYVSLNNGVKMPLEGIGTFLLTPDEAESAVVSALHSGATLIDNADALIAKILRRAELEYEFCSAGDADPATMQIRKACAEYDLTDGFPYTFYKEVVSKVILYRDTHIEVRLQNGQIV